jgi:hypothetical protein
LASSHSKKRLKRDQKFVSSFLLPTDNFLFVDPLQLIIDWFPLPKLLIDL